MKKITLYDPKKKCRNGQVVAFNCNYVLFKVVKTKKKTYLRFEGLTHSDKPCCCSCCTIGGIGSRLLSVPTNSRNCQEYKDVIKFEKEIDKEIKRGKREKHRR